jgi:L-ascorbate metabolism protein UlaG (beta-lactamase superfamily)
MEINFKWFGGGNWMLTADDVKIMCDPLFCPIGSIHDYRLFKSTRISSPQFTESDLNDVDIWLFTHGHKDHCDFGGLRPVASESIIISDHSAFHALKKEGYAASILLGQGSKTSLVFPNDIQISVEAIPAVHGLSAGKGKIVGNGNGYWVDIFQFQNKYSFYASGDTLPNPRTIRAIRNRSCDLFIANVGSATVGKGLLSGLIGRITMNTADAASLGKCLSAKTIVPIHWDAFEHYRERDIFKSCELYNFRYMKQGTTLKIV